MNKQQLLALRHSTEHVLTFAMLRIWGNKIKAAMGPATDEGFYFDFDSEIKISENDFAKIEEEMQKIIKEDLPIIKDEMTIEEAEKFFGSGTYEGNEYKHEWLEAIKDRGEKVSVYWLGEKGKDIPHTFVDICAGPHLSSTAEISAFKLTKIAGAYWHGDEKNKMLQRIYGTAFPAQAELDEYLHLQEEAEKRDHRKLGQELKLFTFSDLVGKGLPTFTPKGATIKRELERFAIDEEIKRGYHHVITPDLAKVDLYKKSGHYPYYKDTMYPIMKIDEEELILRPMTCPHHFMFYKSEPHSYRDLPYRVAEIAHQYRYEKSGELSGLTRVRMFCLADSHIIAAKDQAKQVIKEVLDLIDYANQTFGMVKGVDYRYRLSLGDRSDEGKYYKDDAAWEYAENVLREVLTETGAPFFEAPNEAAFYGPKIDIQVKKVSGQEETAFTVQYDFVMANRFDLSFVNKAGEDEKPIVIHRSSIGCLERTIAFLIEKYAGAFPTWLSPVQVLLAPVSAKHVEGAKNLKSELVAQGIRVEVDEADETVGNKVRKATAQKIPYVVVVGDKELANEPWMIRIRGQEEQEKMNKGEFVERVLREIRDRK
jgi:threonyl-tRNA synthetase